MELRYHSLKQGKLVFFYIKMVEYFTGQISYIESFAVNNVN